MSPDEYIGQNGERVRKRFAMSRFPDPFSVFPSVTDYEMDGLSLIFPDFAFMISICSRFSILAKLTSGS